MVYVFLAQGFEEIEALAVVDVLRRAKIEVATVGVGSKKIKGAHDIIVTADFQEHEVDKDKTKVIVLPGGMPGTTNLNNSKAVHAFLEHAQNNNLLINAICAAPLILGQKQMLKNKKATCYPGFEDQLDGAILSNEPVVIDLPFITAKGPGVAIDFALAIVEQMKSKQVANQIRSDMQI